MLPLIQLHQTPNNAHGYSRPLSAVTHPTATLTPTGTRLVSGRLFPDVGPPTREGTLLAEIRYQPSQHPWVARYPRGIAAHLDYPVEPAFWLLEEAARCAPDRVACRYYRQELTYGQ